ncbi:hypothetical protein NM2005172_2181 [Neisseria meningitidis 2005172]|nr:hypothetical protein NM2005172_2181 [Neisseria meningitidis 2005172]
MISPSTNCPSHQSTCHNRKKRPLSLLHLLLRKLRQLHRRICPRVEHLVFKCLIVQAVCHCGAIIDSIIVASVICFFITNF